jgi:hypothetical protein
VDSLKGATDKNWRMLEKQKFPILIQSEILAALKKEGMIKEQ